MVVVVARAAVVMVGEEKEVEALQARVAVPAAARRGWLADS